MSLLFPRFAFTPAVRCAAPNFRHEISPLWSLFDDATRQLQQVERQARQRSPFNPRFDVKEDKESYILEGEVPGFKDSELSVEWNDNVLAIRGKHESVVESAKKPEVVEPTPAPTTEAPSETGSVKSHQATVEDEEPASGAAAAVEPSGDTATAEQQVSTKTEKTPEVQHWISERRTGQFLRQFSFPSNAVNHEAIKASLESGLLKIVVPKAPVPESRRIDIQ